MNIIKFGGSIVNPDGKYNNSVIDDFIGLVKRHHAESFIFVVGGGKICRFVQSSAKTHLEDALKDPELLARANDRLGIATTLINADYVLRRFYDQLGSEVYPEVILDPTHKVKGDGRVYFTGGWKPGCSTDKDMMLLAKTYHAERVFKISDFEIVKRISPLELSRYSGEDKLRALEKAEDIKEMTWKELTTLVGKEWKPGLNTPFDPEAARLGYRLRKNLIVYIGRYSELPKMLAGEEFRGTVVRD